MKYVTISVAILCLILVVLAGLSCGSSATEPTATPMPASSPTAAPTAEASPESVEEAVLRAYANYWTVYEAALYDLDSTRLAEVMTGPRLERALNEITNLRQEGRAVRILVENEPVVVRVEGDTAMVVDTYENRSHFVHPTTKEQLSNPAGHQTLRDSVTLIRVGESWRVLDNVRSEVAP